MTQYQTFDAGGLPDPVTEAEFYADVPTKRLIAWFVDIVLISLLTALVTILSLFTALFILPVVYGVISFVYRWVSLTRRSATPGMRLVALEMRRADGDRFDGPTALMHTAGYFVSVAVFPLQLISIVLMLMSERRQGLTDMVLGTAALNREAR
ncbi:RDD family protein [Alphaproteobacteria bacterium GH1-50]|uniref:RDD family protein n=2 Tax=Kangsaoukella pontilimi TaxID=2691042 RepID=A0A7C9IER1_9RHOB|nr:RDD family protein [Kangsaoukella pontilimi]